MSFRSTLRRFNNMFQTEHIEGQQRPLLPSDYTLGAPDAAMADAAYDSIGASVSAEEAVVRDRTPYRDETPK